MSTIISEEYLSSLCELTFNSRPLINMLTMLADDCLSDAPSIVHTIETHLSRIIQDKLPTLYLIDSIVKNVGKDYVALFAHNLPALFASVFEKADEKMRGNMFKLRNTWIGIFPADRLILLDTLVNNIDPEWPVSKLSHSTNIHINPNFLKGRSERRVTTGKDDDMREKILKEKKVLLELKKRKVELELLQTKEVLGKKQKELESFTTIRKDDNKPSPILHESIARHSSIKKVVQSHSSILKNIESENSKKLIEVSIRDPRRKLKQTDLATSSPLSNTPSPTSSHQTKLPEAAPSVQLKDHSDDNKDKPPKKKYKTKDKKKPRERDTPRVHKKAYKPKMPDRGKKKNGHSYKPSNSLSEVDIAAQGPSVSDVLDDASAMESLLSSNLADTDLAKPLSLGKHSEVSNKAKHATETPGQELNTGKPTVDTRRPLSDIDDSTPYIPGDPFINIDSISDIDSEISPVDTGRPTVSSTRSSVDKSSLFEISKSSVDTDSPYVSPSNIGRSVNNIVTSDSKLKSSSNVAKPADVNNQVSNRGSDLVDLGCKPDGSFSLNDVEMVDSSSSETSRELFVPHPSVDTISSSLVKPVKRKKDKKKRESCISSSKKSSKRKIHLEDDREGHKKIILAESQITASRELGLPQSVSCKTNSPTSIPEEYLGSQPIDTLSVPPTIHISNIDKEFEKDILKKHVDQPVPTPSLLVNPEETGKDVDLRLLLPRPVERMSASKVDEVKGDKTDVETITLFGGEDVDYRQKPPQTDFSLPSPPPPPVIGNLQEATSKKSWAQIKDKRSEDKSSPKIKPDRLGRPSLSQSSPDIATKENSRQSSQANCNLIIKEAEEQLRTGNITFVEYNKMLHEVVSINEERILKEARARYSNTSIMPDEENNPLSPLSDFDHSFESERVEPTEEVDKTLREPYDSKVVEPPILHSNRPQQPHFPTTAPETFRGRYDFSDTRVWGERRESPLPPVNMAERFSRPAGPIMQSQFPSFSALPFPPNFRPRMPRNVTPPTLLPLVDRDLLLEAESEHMDVISIGDSVRQVRFYGMTAVVLQTWDDPREICFPPGQRRMLVDKRHEFVLQFGAPPLEIAIDDIVALVQLGAPTRELYIDNRSLSMQFGGLPIEIMLCGRVRSISLLGPPPIVRFGPVKRTDLVAGTVTLYVNAKANFILFLDGKPQKFYLDGEPCVLKFADSLLTVLINTTPVPLEFGGFPVPVMFRGLQYFLRLTVLPYGIIPGQISIQNMETYSQPLPLQPPPMPPSMPEPIFIPPQGTLPGIPPVRGGIQQPLDLLANVMNTPALAASNDRSYSIEQPAVEAPSQPATTVPSVDLNNININELFQKLVTTGLVHTTSTEPTEGKNVEEIDVDFMRSETLKLSRPGLVAKLYSGIQCSSCGIRFPPEGTKMYSRHLDWHFRQNRREKHSTRKPQSRRWYYDISDWIQYQEVEDIDDTEPEPVEEEGKGEGEDLEDDIPSVPVGHRKDIKCHVCSESFEEFFNHDTEEWHARNAILLEDIFYHPLCFEEYKTKKESGALDAVEEKLEEEEEEEREEPSTVAFIDLDETDIAVQSPDNKEEITLPLLGPESSDSPEVIAVDDNSDSRSGEANLGEAEIKQEGQEDAVNLDSEEDDDDILGIEVIERKIESYELLDDEDEEEKEEEKLGEDSLQDDNDKSKIEMRDEEKEFDFTKVSIKQEKDRDRLVLDSVDSSVTSYTTTIDGNIVHETAAPLVVPGRIKINIHRSAKTATEGETGDQTSDSSDALALAQPPPPGEETSDPPNVKPNLIGVEFTSQPTVNKGAELSGLCSIM